MHSYPQNPITTKLYKASTREPLRGDRDTGPRHIRLKINIVTTSTSKDIFCIYVYMHVKIVLAVDQSTEHSRVSLNARAGEEPVDELESWRG